MKKIYFIVTVALVVIFLGRYFLPGSMMFDFHDETQPARISDFTFDIQHFQIPPRIAPHFSFNLGYPVFNFYAPFSYWITAGFHLASFDIADSIKLAFLMAVLVGFTGMYFFLRNFFDDFPALLGASLFVSSPYIAMESFIRGNLGEIWLIFLIPWVLYFLFKNSTSHSKYIFAGTAFVISCTVSAHNILSLILLPFLVVYIFFLKSPKKNIIALILGLLLSSYYLVPAVLESSLTYAAEAAKRTNYIDHFLCLNQLWTGQWGYGGSLPGCDKDGLSFMVGKFQILLSVAGSLFLLYQVIQKKFKENEVFILILLFTTVSAFLTLYQSAFVWNILAPLFALFQFPWRFLAFVVFGNAVLGAYLFSKFKNPILNLFIIIFIVLPIIYNAKFFMKQELTKSTFNSRYLSTNYINQNVAYKITEYLPKTVNYQEWMKYEPQPNDSQKSDPYLTDGPVISLDNQSVKTITNTEFAKSAETNSKKVLLNIHYFPFWQITNDKTQIMPTTFDTLGRPILELSSSENKTINVIFKQTPIEKTGNIISVMVSLFLLALLIHPNLWKRLQTMLS